ncbi:PocR ligand-binding domain-containing protein [Desulfobacterales bacterium HSG16]|nr:PocR ligand-binding domain-containing protein [Desulfobacterales bacterium HSG16]
MKMTDVASVETWKNLEKSIVDMSGLNASVFDNTGYRITDHMHWCNELCPEVKATEKGQTFICAIAHTNIASMAEKSKKPVIEECDGGMVKIVVPVFVKDEFIGAVGGCGFILDDGEVDAFYISKTTGIEEEKIELLAKSVKTMKTEKAGEIAGFIEGEIGRIVSMK